MKRYRFLGIVSGLFILLFSLQLFRLWVERTNNPSQLERSWAQGEKYAQINTYFTNQANVTEKTIEVLRHQFEDDFAEYKAKDGDEAEKLWTDAYSSIGTAYVKYKKNEVNANAIYVGGEFFLFHPLPLAEGTYLPTDNPNFDFILLDEESAWQLFGSIDIVGMEVEIGKDTYRVTGVIKKEKNLVSNMSGRTEPTVYLPYAAAEKKEEHPYVHCYEVCIPNPVNQYAYNRVNDAMVSFRGESEIVVYNNRFSSLNRLKDVPNFFARSMQTVPVKYPYWENEMRGFEDLLTVTIVVQIVVFVVIIGIIGDKLAHFGKVGRIKLKRVVHDCK